MEQHNTNRERQAAYEQGKQLADFLFKHFRRSTWQPLIVKTGERDQERVIFDDGSHPAVSRVTPALLHDIKEAVEHPEKLLNSEAIGKKLSIEFNGEEVFVKPAPLIDASEMNNLVAEIHGQFDIPADAAMQIAIGKRIVCDTAEAEQNHTVTQRIKGFIQFAIKEKQQTLKEKPVAKSGIDLEITADRQEVYRMEGGRVLINRGYDHRRHEVSETVALETPATAPQHQPTLTPTEPAATASLPPANSNEQSMEPEKPPPAKPAAAREPAPRLDTHDFTALVREPRPDVVTQPWMTDEPRHKLSRAMAENFTVLRQKRVATTALALLQKYGETQGHQSRFEAEGYHLTSEGALIRIADRHHKELALIHKPGLGRLRLVKYDLTAAQEGDFLSANTVIRQRGLPAITEDPFIRRQQLGALAPAGDRSVIQDLQALGVAQIARRYLDAVGVKADKNGQRSYAGQRYTIVETREKNLYVGAHQRGAVLSIDQGRITSTLSREDLATFRSLQTLLNKTAVAQNTPLKMPVKAPGKGPALGD